MGINCEIKIFKTTDGYFKPGGSVSGIMKYTLGEETLLERITVSLKGNLFLLVKQKRGGSTLNTYKKTDDYVDIDYIIHTEGNGVKLPEGTYQTEFSFLVPENIPPSLKFAGKTSKYYVKCHILYCIQIKFEKPGLMNVAKYFGREVKIVSDVPPKLSTTPTVFSEEKSLSRMFCRRRSKIKINAVIESSIVCPGDKIKIEYEVHNDTFLTIKCVLAKLIEIYTFKGKGKRKAKFFEDVKGTYSRSGQIAIGDTVNDVIEITVPCNISSIEYMNVVSREYFVNIIVELPSPHRNMMVKIPVQIGEDIQSTEEENAVPPEPPSYWEVLLENDERSLNRNDTDEENED